MAASIDFSALTLNPNDVRDFGALIRKSVLNAPQIESVFNVYTGITNSDYIGLIRPTLGLIGKADGGCGAGANVAGQAPTFQKQWDLKRLRIEKHECYTDLSTNLAKFYRNTGTDISDLTNTQYLDYIASFIPDDINRMIWRKAWFDDTAADTFANGGKLKNGTDKTYFNVINGLWKQIFAITTATPTQKVAIAGAGVANNAATTATQFSTLTPDLALAAYQALVDAASPTLLAEPDLIFISTRSIAQKAARKLQSLGQDSVLQKMEGGYELSTIDGIQNLTVPFMDEVILKYFNNGTTLDNPHRILLTTKSNLGLAFEGEEMFKQINIVFSAESEKNIIRIIDAMDAKVIDDEKIMLAI